MNIKNIITATALIAAAASAFAEAPYPAEQPFVSTKTRAEVIAELQQAGGNPARDNYQATFNPTTVAAGGKTRAQVIAELKNAKPNLARANYQDTTH